MLVYLSNHKYNVPVLTLSGPSGIGKTTLAKRLEKKYQFSRVRPFTSRVPRSGEELAGIYRFVPHVIIEEYIKKDRAAVIFFFLGNFYGFLWEDIFAEAEKEKRLLFEVYTQSIVDFRKVLTQSVSIFLKPATLNLLTERMKSRGDATLNIEKRLSNAVDELLFFERNKMNFDEVLVISKVTSNDELSEKVNDIFSTKICK